MALETGTNIAAVCHQHSKSPPLTTPQESSDHHHHHHILPHYSKLHLQAPKLVIIFAVVAFSCLLLYHSSPASARFQAYNPFAATKLGTNSDADIMWFRDPFPHFHEDGDFQIACDYFRGNSTNLNNLPNGGFTYVKSNNKTIQFYKFWYDSRLTYPDLHDQDVFNKIKFDPFILENGLQIRFLDTSYFGGFCEPSRDFDKVCTMHANCCVGLDNKVHDIGIMLRDWRKYLNSFMNQTAMFGASWTVPQSCRGSFQRPRLPKKKDDHGSKS